jgi:sigma-B regulation protein RsbU (phosphoserine phosphatase)
VSLRVDLNSLGAPEPEALILVVDDDPAVRNGVCRVLRRGGYYHVLAAADAPAARQILQTHPVEVAVVDLNLPGMDGLSLMQWAQQQCLRPEWIILSGAATFDDAVKAVKLGAFDFLTKPLIRVDSLVVSVNNALTRRRLVQDQARLTAELADRNRDLDRKVVELKDALQALSEQAETINQDLVRAELVQRTLLPRLTPTMGSFSFDALYRPSYKVGGDLYDVLPVDDRRTAFYVADAAGHGVSAAMVAVLFKLRLRIRDELPNHPFDPAESLREVNKAIHKECTAPGLFITAAVCLLDIKTGELTVASGGHPPLLLHRASGETEMIFHTGPALGLSEEARFANVSKTLHTGDRLLIYTDGLTDPGLNSEGLSTEELSAMLSDPAYSRQAFLRRLLAQATERHQPIGNEDDITLILLTAGDSGANLDNCTAPSPGESARVVRSARGSILAGVANGHTTFSVLDRGCWTLAAAFHDTCNDELLAGHTVLLDLARCHYLDSTFLGTIQETVDAADAAAIPYRIQGVLPQIKRLFEELSMDRVLRHVAPDSEPLPENMTPLALSKVASHRNRQRILHAHEALASLDERNQGKFLALIQSLQEEVGKI